MEKAKCIGCRRDERFVYAIPQCPVHGLETIDWNPTNDRDAPSIGKIRGNNTVGSR